MKNQTDNTQNRRILYSNTALIGVTLDCYKKTVGTLQCLIHDLSSEGVPVTDETLIDLLDRDGKDTTDALGEAIEAEVRGQKFPATKDAIRKQLAPLYAEIDRAIEKVEAALVHNPYEVTSVIHLDFDNFTVKDLNVSLIEGLEQLVTDENTIYSDTDPLLTEAYERAEKLAAEIADFNSSLRKYGDFITPVGGDRPFVTISTTAGYKAVIEPRALPWLKRKNSGI